MTETFIGHCEKMYNALNDRATDKELESGKNVRIFAGSWTEVWRSVDISQTYYKPVREALVRHGAIEILQKGGRDADTVVLLNGLPSEDEWQIDGWDNRRSLTSAARYATLAAEVTEINRKLGGLDLVKLAQDIESRLDSLQQQLDEVKTQLAEMSNK